jgi:hypothetical protein
MSASSAINASSATETRLGRSSRFHLPSPAVTVALLMACVFLLRLPSALVPHELHIDESEFLVQAMKFLVDPRPFLSGETGTSGPLNSYFIAVFLWIGFKPGFVLVHILASVFVCLEVLTAYLTLRRLKSEGTAALGAFLMVLLYGLATDKDYLHYAGELLPNLLLMAGFYIFVVWVGGPAEQRASASRWLLFSGGLVLGAAPWSKLQAAPITLAIGLLFLAAVLSDRGRSFSLSRRLKELIAFSVGAVLTTCVMLAILAKCGAISDFWHSYIQGNLAYAGSLSLTSIIANFWFTFLTWPIHEPLLVAFLGLGLLVRTSPSANVLLFSKEKKWACNGVLIYAGGALMAICRSQYSFHHYTIFLVPPMTYLAAVALSAPPEAVKPIKSRRSPPRVTLALVLILVFATIGGIQYANMVRVIGELSHGPLDRNPRIAKAPGVPVMNSNNRMAKLKYILGCAAIMQCSWEVRDSSEKIAAVVRDIQATRPVQSMAIWGWAPGVYVLTGILPATRDSATYSQIMQGPMQTYFRARFLVDLRQKPPDLFIDAVAPDAVGSPRWTGNYGYESDPQLRKFVEDNYILIDQLTLVKGAKPVRFFARREAIRKS